MPRQTKSAALQHTIDFIKTPKDNEFVFVCEKSEMRGMIQRMRVELSRLRQRVIDMNKVPAQFKMIFVEARDIKDVPNFVEVVLRKQVNASHQFNEDITRALNDLTIGDKVL